jgi:hypothetical protein
VTSDTEKKSNMDQIHVTIDGEVRAAAIVRGDAALPVDAAGL